MERAEIEPCTQNLQSDRGESDWAGGEMRDLRGHPVRSNAGGGDLKINIREQTSALPEMLLRIADNHDEDVYTATAAMTSLLSP